MTREELAKAVRRAVLDLLSSEREAVIEAAREVRATDKAWMSAGAPDYGELANAAADAHMRLEAALAALDKREKGEG